MTVSPIRTRLIHPGSASIIELVDEAVDEILPGSVVAITSKVVALCEGRVFDPAEFDKTDVIERESEYFLPRSSNRYNVCLTIKQNRLIPSAGVDESNTGGYIVPWPENPQRSADEIWRHLRNRFDDVDVGVLITDSTSAPLRLGVAGISVAHSGFSAINDLVGTTDLFGRPLAMTRMNVSAGLAAAAVVGMGEAAEQTPIAVITDLPFVRFQDRVPSEEELQFLSMPIQDDLYAPLLERAPWIEGGSIRQRLSALSAEGPSA